MLQILFCYRTEETKLNIFKVTKKLKNNVQVSHSASRDVVEEREINCGHCTTIRRENISILLTTQRKGCWFHILKAWSSTGLTVSLCQATQPFAFPVLFAYSSG